MNLLLTLDNLELTQANTIISGNVSSLQSLTQGSPLFIEAVLNIKKAHEQHNTFLVWNYEKTKLARVTLHTEYPVNIPETHFLSQFRGGYLEVELL